ncbi:hypothetical protein GCM10011351_07890 [Paraliobacillus quinghaiensis]|uniref:Uncharacterized protein n=1 Tax=Paraliobacillus quinghaiensis TaxID=470815 RepID=A0A917TIW9_9BACI|nr:hypothetical protein [Paraliobacillus quinghaiensis]GGM24529.1 hypothetical protein GCM10011351_07890 [Paraliobacillus quinghaiensis]
MLTFEEKLAIIESYPMLERNDVSLGRVNFKFKESVIDKENVVYHLHPNGNGYVFAELIDDDYDIDTKGMVNIRDFSEKALRKVIDQSIASLSEQEPFEETWINRDKETLLLVNDFDSWNIYAGNLLEATYATYNGAVDYLKQEGFRPSR